MSRQVETVLEAVVEGVQDALTVQPQPWAGQTDRPPVPAPPSRCASLQSV